MREAGEERAGSGNSKRAGGGREMQNPNYLRKVSQLYVVKDHFIRSQYTLVFFGAAVKGLYIED